MISDRIRELLLPLMIVTIVLAVYVVGWAQVRLQDAIHQRDANESRAEQVAQVPVAPVGKS